ncbi:LPS export ABC transporter permease LptG [Methylophilus sp. YYY-1]|uniref:LPS export ABC transporter permease LptG n=1 Tax=Methylophilus sp. YYY-1 TaxID=2682087 RepID=UPI0023B248A0|nr:LPS export ABC transporter permease LptG [Methylophilus sp. YYY-1]MDF0379191.1 LPS export ABC transporter permease LptG [Methylophilus sp. YYY-1]
MTLTRLNRYFWQEISFSIMLVLLGLLAMFSFFDLLQELDSLGRGHYGINSMLIYVALSIPGHIYEVAPVAVLLGIVYTLGAMAGNSELIVMRTSGISLQSIAMILLKIGLVFALVTFLIGEIIAPISEKLAQRIRIQATDSVVAQDFQSGLWIKDGSSFVNVSSVMPDTSLVDIRIYDFDPQFKLKHISHAEKGYFQDDHWVLSNVTQTNINHSKQIQDNSITSQFFKQTRWESLIRPELLNVLLVLPEKMSAWNLYSFIQYLHQNGQRSTRYQVALWAKLVYPLACLVMVVLALPFGFLQQRAGGISAKIFAGIFLGVVYQIMNRVFVHLGVLNDWPPLVSAISPTLLFLLVGLGMLYYVERR